MNLGELIVKLRNIGDRFTSWFLIDTNVESIELIGHEGDYKVDIKIKKEPINEEELNKLAEEYADKAPMTGDSYSGYDIPCWGYSDIIDAFKAGYRKALNS